MPPSPPTPPAYDIMYSLGSRTMAVARRRFRRFPRLVGAVGVLARAKRETVIRVVLADDGVMVQDAAGTRATAWSELTGVASDEHTILLVRGDLPVIYLPTFGLRGEGEAAALIAYARERIGSAGAAAPRKG